ncbi:DcrB-related protein [Chondromyces apiculatus]|uniref:DUF1795 domain-containing protein n=1 Tax=Chondromyces apiculatus DSM 436 TaxID=1192034 RepID=A0A017T6S6_9BACT|nr:DcrB-related protein [Chondromyces apiculatus]EYF04712.1 Hypothetical protein CAP_4187 [Chondromyces apiculatus DSM 436]
MTSFQANEFSTRLPEGLKDKTVNVFSLTDDGPSDLSVVVIRDRPLQGEALAVYVERQLGVLQQRLPLFRILHRGEAVLDGEPAVQLDYTWMSGPTAMFQRQVILYAPLSGGVLLVSATCKGRLEPAWEEMFGAFLADFRLNR